MEVYRRSGNDQSSWKVEFKVHVSVVDEPNLNQPVTGFSKQPATVVPKKIFYLLEINIGRQLIVGAVKLWYRAINGKVAFTLEASLLI